MPQGEERQGEEKGKREKGETGDTNDTYFASSDASAFFSSSLGAAAETKTYQ